MRWWRSKTFWEDTLERVVMTTAQAAISTIGVDGVVDAMTLDWKSVAGIALGAGLLALLKSLGAGMRGDPKSASLVQ